MPNLTIQYSKELETSDNIERLVQAVHDSSFSSGLFTENTIKITTLSCNYTLVAGKKALLISISVQILPGRNTEIKKQLSQDIWNAVSKLDFPVETITVETSDIIQETYIKTAE